MYGDYEPKVVNITQYTVRAKKKHDCAMCDSIIFPGQYYVRTVNKVDDDIVVERHHSSHDMTDEEARDAYLYSRHEKY